MRPIQLFHREIGDIIQIRKGDKTLKGKITSIEDQWTTVNLLDSGEDIKVRTSITDSNDPAFTKSNAIVKDLLSIADQIRECVRENIGMTVAMREFSTHFLDTRRKFITTVFEELNATEHPRLSDIEHIADKLGDALIPNIKSEAQDYYNRRNFIAVLVENL